MYRMQNKEVELVNINEKLASLRDQELGKDKTRSCLFNLIVYTQKALRDEYYETLIHAFISKFPCRILWVVEEGNTDHEYLKVQVGSQTIRVGENEIFCEEIRVNVAGEEVQKVPYLLLPHILPDLPVYLFWTDVDKFLQDSLSLMLLEKLATRIIFDATLCQDLQKLGKTLSQFHLNCQKPISDLNWIALGAWRRVIKALFHTEKRVEHLRQSRIIEITYNDPLQAQEVNPLTKSAYLTSWLAAQLQWQYKSIHKEKEATHLLFTQESREIEVLLRPAEERLVPAGSILGIDIESQVNANHYSLKRDPHSRRVFVQCSNRLRCNLPYSVSLKGLKLGEELVEEIFYNEIGSHYYNMLPLLSQIPWK